MYVIMGGTGHVGSATADELLRRGEPVAIVTRNARRADPWRAKGAEKLSKRMSTMCLRCVPRSSEASALCS